MKGFYVLDDVENYMTCVVRWDVCMLRKIEVVGTNYLGIYRISQSLSLCPSRCTTHTI